MSRKTDGLDISIGVNLRNIREYKKISRKEVGNYINVTHQQIAKYEAGINRISASNLYRLACYYGKNMNDFLMITIEGLEADWRKTK